MIKIRKIDPPKVSLYAPDGTFLGNLNEYEFLAARVEIMIEKVSGYYAVFNGAKIRIDRRGTLEHHPEGLLSLMSHFYSKLIIR